MNIVGIHTRPISRASLSNISSTSFFVTQHPLGSFTDNLDPRTLYAGADHQSFVHPPPHEAPPPAGLVVFDSLADKLYLISLQATVEFLFYVGEFSHFFPFFS